MSEHLDPPPAAASPLPRQLGPYRILGLLGQGASGRVYRAQEEEPHRQVALKVLRTAALSRDAELRFRREAELLARLEHPAIARLYRAGIADTGTGPVPYLAMELVDGTDLLTFATTHHLGLQEKLALLAEISRAVHYAHTRGVLHRDLKPGNILVDARGQPHILDVGVGHCLIGDDAALTVAGQILGTVPYMSPEQLAGGPAGSDPRTDVYALGVIAYELICGSLPFPGLSTSTVLEAIALLLAGRAEPLGRRLAAARGDIDTVVMKAMAPEAAQRYGSAAELAADLDRIRASEPISARPPALRYLLGLFLRRHRALSAAAAVVIVALIAATIVSTRFAVSEAEARNIAEGRAAELAAVNDLLNNMVKSADPTASRGRQVTVAETIDVARKELVGPTSLSAGAQVRLAATLAGLYEQLGEPETGAEIAQAAYDKLGAGLSADDPARLNLALTLANNLNEIGKVDESLTAIEPLLTLPRSTGERERLRVRARTLQVDLLNETGKPDQALPLLDALAQEAQQTLGPGDLTALQAEGDRIRLLMGVGRYDEVKATARALIEREDRTIGHDHWLTLQTRDDFANALYAMGSYPEAEQEIRAVVAERLRLVGPEHYATLIGQYTLGLVLEATHRSAEAEPIVAHAVSGLQKILGGGTNSELLNVKLLQAAVARGVGKRKEAEALYRYLIAAHQDRTDDTPWEKLVPARRLGGLLIEEGRATEAEVLLQVTLDRARTLLGEQTRYYAFLESTHGQALNSLKHFAPARAELEHALAILLPMLGPTHPETQSLYQRLALCYAGLGLQDEAAAAQAKLVPQQTS